MENITSSVGFVEFVETKKDVSLIFCVKAFFVWLGLVLLAVLCCALKPVTKLVNTIKEKIAKKIIGKPNLPVGKCKS